MAVVRARLRLYWALPMSSDQPVCGQCGSSKLRRARSHHAAHRLVREWSEFERYACGDCGHRGWRHGKLPHPEQGILPPSLGPGGRPVEHRDIRVRRRLRLRTIVMVVLGLFLGYVVASFVMRMTSLPPPQ